MTQDVTAGKGRGRKPADTPNYNLVGYEAAWAAIRELKTFTNNDLVIFIAKKKCWSVNDNTVKDYVYRLKNGGYLEVSNIDQKGGVSRLYTYTLVRDVGINAPRLQRDGSLSTMGMGRLNLWRSMKILKEFDYRELSATATNELVTVKEIEAKDYVFHLEKAGYLKKVKPANNAGSLARYRLIPSKFTGPKAPQIQRVKQVYDPNLQQVMKRQEPEPC